MRVLQPAVTYLKLLFFFPIGSIFKKISNFLVVML